MKFCMPCLYALGLSTMYSVPKCLAVSLCTLGACCIIPGRLDSFARRDLYTGTSRSESSPEADRSQGYKHAQHRALVLGIPCSSLASVFAMESLPRYRDPKIYRVIARHVIDDARQIPFPAPPLSSHLLPLRQAPIQARG